jgi:galactoside O-acetyltransferase
MLKCAERIEIGDDVEIAWDCTIVDHDWESLVWERRRTDVRAWYTAQKDWTHVKVASVTIRDRALVGFGAVILKGVTIGEGAVVGAASVVTRDVPPYAVVAGAPARVVRRLEGAGGAECDRNGHSGKASAPS